MCRTNMSGSDYLSFPELSPDLHSVEVPSGVAAPVVVSYPDFLNHVTDILQLGRDSRVLTAAAAASDGVRSITTHLDNEHVFCSPLKI